VSCCSLSKLIPASLNFLDFDAEKSRNLLACLALGAIVVQLRQMSGRPIEFRGKGDFLNRLDPGHYGHSPKAAHFDRILAVADDSDQGGKTPSQRRPVFTRRNGDWMSISLEKSTEDGLTKMRARKDNRQTTESLRAGNVITNPAKISMALPF
jgi:hypothetical protein